MVDEQLVVFIHYGGSYGIVHCVTKTSREKNLNGIELPTIHQSFLIVIYSNSIIKVVD